MGVRLQLAAVALMAILLVSWLAAPAVVSHLAVSEPLWFETVALNGHQPHGGLAFRSRLPSRLDSRWSTGFTRVLENGEALERGRLRAVQREPGKFTANPQAVFFSTGDGSDPRSNGRVYAVQVPRRVTAAGARLLASLFLGLHLAAAVALLPALFRQRFSPPVLLFIGLALAGFAIIGVGADRLPLTQGPDLLGERLDDFRRDKDSFDALFLGSSRVYRQLDPRVFDAVFEERGTPMRSFNLGTPGTRMLEVLSTVRWVLALRPQRLRLLVVDCNGDPLRIEWENLQTARVIRYHGMRNTIALLQAIAASDNDPAEKLHEMSAHLQTAALRAASVGRGLHWVASATSDRSPVVPPRNRGYLTLDEALRRTENSDELLQLGRRYDALHSNLGHYRELERKLPRLQKRRPRLDELEVSLFRALQEEARRHGVRVVFLIDSRVNLRYDLVRAFEIGAVDTLLRFDDPSRFPELYDPANRFDIHHLNEQTAKVYTRLVAKRILELAEPR